MGEWAGSTGEGWVQVDMATSLETLVPENPNL